LGFFNGRPVFFGWGVLEELRTVAKEFGKRVMVCSDKNIIKSGIADKSGIVAEGRRPKS
jgi:alcohol dehydrogenase class IV